MKSHRSLFLTAGLLCTVSAWADMVDTVAFTPVNFPNIPEAGAPPGSNFLYLAAGDTVPTGINDSGQIVGHFQSLDCCQVGAPHPFGTLGFLETSGGAYGGYDYFYAYASDGVPILCQYCGNILDTPNTYPAGINNSDTIVGSYTFDTYADLAGFAIPTSAIFSTLDLSSIQYPGLTPGGFSSTQIIGIDGNGDLIGTYDDTFAGTSGGFLLNSAGFTPLSFTPLAINNLGQILGENGAGQIIVDTNGNIQNLGMLPFTPTGFNDAGMIVGGDYVYLNGDLTQIQLQGQPGVQVQINAINDSGEFVGTYTGNNGEFGFAATTPEPGALGALLAGVCGLAFRRRRWMRSGQSI